MIKNLIKVISKNEVYIVEQKESAKRSNGILYGNAVRTSINKTDSYYFATDIQIIHKDSILTTEEVSNDESMFFEWLRSEKEVPFSRKLVNLYTLKDFKELDKE